MGSGRGMASLLLEARQSPSNPRLGGGHHQGHFSGTSQEPVRGSEQGPQQEQIWCRHLGDEAQVQEHGGPSSGKQVRGVGFQKRTDSLKGRAVVLSSRGKHKGPVCRWTGEGDSSSGGQTAREGGSFASGRPQMGPDVHTRQGTRLRLAKKVTSGPSLRQARFWTASLRVHSREYPLNGCLVSGAEW